MKRYQKFFTGLMIHCIVSGVMWSGVCVYQRSYNIMHSAPVRMASVTIRNQEAEIQILHRSWPVALPEKSDMLYYYLYLMTDNCLHNWVYLTDFMNHS